MIGLHAPGEVLLDQRSVVVKVRGPFAHVWSASSCIMDKSSQDMVRGVAQQVCSHKDTSCLVWLQNMSTCSFVAPSPETDTT